MENPPTIVLGVTVNMSLSFLRDFPQALAAAGWTVHVVSGPGPGFDEFRNVEGVHVHEIPMERGPRPLRDLASLWKWIELIRKVRPDVVSVGTPKASFLGLIAAFICRVPKRTYHLRGLRLEGETGAKYVLLRAMEKLTVAVATDVLAVSHSLRDVALKLDIVDPRKISVIGAGSSNGVDLEYYRPGFIDATERSELLASLRLNADVPVIGFVGRLARDKGIEDLLLASRELQKRGIQHQLLLVGNLEDQFLRDPGSLQNAASSPVRITGRVKNAQRYYQLMEVLVLPTLREGMPNVALEAQASGVPVITTDVTGARESIVDGRTGFLTSYGDISGMTDAIEQILSNPDLRKSMAKAGREFVEKHFDRYEVWAGLMTYYSERHSTKPKKLRNGKLDFS